MSDAPVPDLVVEQLKLLRGDIRDLRTEQSGTNERLDRTIEHIDHMEAALVARLTAVETTVRDLAEQMVILVRAVRVTLEHRKEVDSAIDDLRRRVTELEAER